MDSNHDKVIQSHLSGRLRFQLLPMVDIGLCGAVEFFSAKQAGNSLHRMQQSIGRKRQCSFQIACLRLKQQSDNLPVLIRLNITMSYSSELS